MVMALLRLIGKMATFNGLKEVDRLNRYNRRDGGGSALFHII